MIASAPANTELATWPVEGTWEYSNKNDGSWWLYKDGRWKQQWPRGQRGSQWKRDQTRSPRRDVASQALAPYSPQGSAQSPPNALEPVGNIYTTPFRDDQYYYMYVHLSESNSKKFFWGRFPFGDVVAENTWRQELNVVMSPGWEHVKSDGCERSVRMFFRCLLKKYDQPRAEPQQPQVLMPQQPQVLMPQPPHVMMAPQPQVMMFSAPLAPTFSGIAPSFVGYAPPAAGMYYVQR